MGLSCNEEECRHKILIKANLSTGVLLGFLGEITQGNPDFYRSISKLTNESFADVVYSQFSDLSLMFLALSSGLIGSKILDMSKKDSEISGYIVPIICGLIFAGLEVVEKTNNIRDITVFLIPSIALFLQFAINKARSRWDI